MIPERPTSSSTRVTQEFLQKPQDYFIKDIEIVLDSPAVCTQWLPHSGMAALGCEDGATRILSPLKKTIQYTLVKDDKSPVMSIASVGPNSTIKNTLLIAHSQGTLEYWHATSNQLLFQKKYEQSLQSCQISVNSQWYVVSKQSGQMLLGNLDKGNPTSLQTGHLGAHSNRVFCIKWHPTQNNYFFSGGWDKAIFMWDIRTKTSIKCMYGYYIGGQSIDINGNDVLLGNNRNQFHLRVYDLKGDKVRSINWQHYNSQSAKCVTGVNSCCFGKQEGQVLAMSSRNQIRYFKNQKCLSMFEHSNENAQGFSMSQSPNDKTVIATWSTGQVKVMAY